MKTSSLWTVLGIVILGLFLSFTTPVFGDDDMLNQALDLVRQAWNSQGDQPDNATRTELLTKALPLAQNSPQKHTQHHRVNAIHDIQAALTEIKNGDPNNQAKEYIRDADSELRTAISDER